MGDILVRYRYLLVSAMFGGLVITAITDPGSVTHWIGIGMACGGILGCLYLYADILGTVAESLLNRGDPR